MAPHRFHRHPERAGPTTGMGTVVDLNEASRRGLNRSEFYAEALAAHLKELRADDVTEAINAALDATDPDDHDLAQWVERGGRATVGRTR